MSSNLKFQDEIELQCLNEVIRIFNSKDCFGMSEKEVDSFYELLSNTKVNQNGTTFPDFIIDKGFIEHFEVTSSLQNKKGSKQKTASIKFAKSSKNFFEQTMKESEEYLPRSQSFKQDFEEHSQKNIQESIKKNWDKHIISCEKFDGEKKNSVFLLEYSDHGMLQTATNFDVDCKVYDSYKISLDEIMLNWIYQYKDTIKYFILYNKESLEVVKIDGIPNLILTQLNSIVVPTIGLESHSFYPITFNLDQ